MKSFHFSNTIVHAFCKRTDLEPSQPLTGPPTTPAFWLLANGFPLGNFTKANGFPITGLSSHMDVHTS